MIIPADNMEGKNAEVVVGGVALIGVGGDEVGGNHTMTKIADVIETQILGGTKVVDVDMLIRVIQGEIGVVNNLLFYSASFFRIFFMISCRVLVTP